MNLEKMDLDTQSEDKIFLAVYMITYNHENFIEQSIESVLAQNTNFPYKLFIGEDHSTDQTQKICLRFKNKYPNKIHLIQNDKNIGPSKNANNTFNLCFNSGAKYIAMLEGDDYWTDPFKLQRQVDFLEQNQDYVLCFHRVNVLKSDGSLVEDFLTKVPPQYEERKTLATHYNYIHTPSVVFRNVTQEHIQLPEFKKSPIGDYFLYVILSQYGKIGYLDEIMAVYRHGSGIYSKLNELKHNKTNLLLYLNLYSFEKDPIIKEIFYNHILNFVNPTYEKLQKYESLLGTRRHVFIERLYLFTKKILNSVKK